MDPTKPILTLNDNYNGCFYRDVTIRTPEREKPGSELEERCRKLEQERNFYKEQYQKLYREYHDMEVRGKEHSQLKQYIRELEQKVSLLERSTAGRPTAGGASSHELRVLSDKNEQLSQLLLKKNYELEEAYRKLQQPLAQMRSNGNLQSTQAKKILMSVDRLEDGTKEAIYSNFELLKNNSINEIRGLLRNVRTNSTTSTRFESSARVY